MSIDYVIDAARHGVYCEVTGGGEAMRQAVDDTGAGVEFWADAGFIGRLEPRAGNELALVAYNNGEPFKPTGESPFWDEILTFRGRLASEGMASSRRGSGPAGPWGCAAIPTPPSLEDGRYA